MCIYRKNKLANIHWIIEIAREFQKNIYYFCFIDYAKAFHCVDHNKLWKILKQMGILDYFTNLLRNLYGGQETTVRTRHGTMDWFTTRKEYVKKKKKRQEYVNAVYCHPADLTYKQNTSCEMLG